MKSVLLLKVAEIPDDGLRLRVDQDEPCFAQTLRALDEGEGSVSAAIASLVISSWPDRVDVEGSLGARLSANCSRCANTFVQDVEREFLRVFLRSEPEVLSDDLELSPSDLDRDLLPADELNLGELLGEELVLALPVKPLCMTDCKGICAGCGADLNDLECSCEPIIDDRWSVLQDLTLDG